MWNLFSKKLETIKLFLKWTMDIMKRDMILVANQKIVAGQKLQNFLGWMK